MFYRIYNNKIYDWANYNYADDCLETSIITEDEYSKHPNKVIVSDGVLIENPNYEQEEEQKRIKQFQQDFFNTSLGYVRRAVHMKDGSVKDFLSDILPLLKENIPIITYNIDRSQNTNVLVTAEFIEECKQQLLVDFYGSQLNN